MSHKKQGFTLIELLVVIAIIAILAAILFPVFAAAKEAAKNTTLTSNVKQTGTACLMYCADNDDMFPLVWRAGDDITDDVRSWQGQIMPYAKSWPLMTNPKLPSPSGDYAWWYRMNHMGTLPRANAVNTPAVKGYYETGWNGTTTLSDGVMGAGLGGYNYLDAGSLTQSQINTISESVLVSEAGAWDYFVGPYDSTTPFGSCGNWGAPYNAHEGVFMGASTTTRPKDGHTGLQKDCYYPSGMTTYVATDGSAKAVDFNGRLMETITLADGSKAFKRYWPKGQ
jgi:prepilin-type N-terminal cleavage/methylation domain-containing protein